MENLTVKQFCEHFEKLNSDDAKQRYVKSVIRRTYAPFVEKMALCKQMAEKSVRITDQGVGYVDMCANKLNIIGVIIGLYTTLTYDKDKEGKPDVAGCYDALYRTGTMDAILNCIEADVNELMTINGTCLDSINAEFCSVQSYIARQIEKMSFIMGALENYMEKQTQEVPNTSKN